MTHEPSDPAPSAPDPALARDLGRLLDELVDQTAGEAIDQGDDPELTPPVSRVLRALAGAPGPRTVEQVARATGMRARAARAAVTEARRAELVEVRGREPRSLALTAEGRRALTRVEEARRASLLRFVARLDRAQRMRLSAALDLLGGHLPARRAGSRALPA
jgi:DNA-binding MarR family transcriptional regulator